MISEEDSASGSGTRLDYSELLFYYSEKGQEKFSFFFFPEKVFAIDIRRGMENAPLASLIKALYTFTRPTPTTYILN